MSMLPFVLWALTLVIGLIIYVAVAYTIEKAGLKRLGATGHLFTCNPERKEEKAVGGESQ